MTRRLEEKGTTEDGMVGWHHQLNGHEFEQAPEDGEGQGSLVCCSSWDRKESDTTEVLCAPSPLLIATGESIPLRGLESQALVVTDVMGVWKLRGYSNFSNSSGQMVTIRSDNFMLYPYPHIFGLPWWLRW